MYKLVSLYPDTKIILAEWNDRVLTKIFRTTHYEKPLADEVATVRFTRIPTLKTRGTYQSTWLENQFNTALLAGKLAGSGADLLVIPSAMLNPRGLSLGVRKVLNKQELQVLDQDIAKLPRDQRANGVKAVAIGLLSLGRL